MSANTNHGLSVPWMAITTSTMAPASIAAPTNGVAA
jgi:hypothetical protein